MYQEQCNTSYQSLEYFIFNVRDSLAYSVRDLH